MCTLYTFNKMVCENKVFLCGVICDIYSLRNNILISAIKASQFSNNAKKDFGKYVSAK